MQGGKRKAVENSGILLLLDREWCILMKQTSIGGPLMKLKNTKLFLCGLLAAMFLIRNLQDSQFAMSFFFAVVTWQCLRAAFEARGFEEGADRQAAFRAAAKAFYGPVAGISWALPYGALALCAVIGAVQSGLRMPMVYLFLAVVVIHSICEALIWKKAAKQ